MYIRVPKFREDLKSLEVKIGIFFMKVTKLDDDGLTIYDLCTIAMVRIHFHILQFTVRTCAYTCYTCKLPPLALYGVCAHVALNVWCT